MNKLLATTKGKIIAAISSVGIIGAVIAVIVFLNREELFRIIEVNDFTGGISITHESSLLTIFKGLRLNDGDEVNVPADNSLTLFVDNDKYIYAEENTHFWIEAKGKPGDTKTRIKQDKGTNLYRVDQKLQDSEYFDVNTSNASLSVRGTVFRVACSVDENGYVYTVLEVFEGEVYVEAMMEDGSSTGKNKTLVGGQKTIIRSDPTFSEFVEDENGNEIQPIDYSSLPQDTARNLGDAIDAGRDIGIDKEVLFDYVEIIKHENVISDESIEATHTSKGLIVEICTICGKRTENEIDMLSEGEGHEFENEIVDGTCEQPGKVIKKCKDCGEIIEETVTDKIAHNYVDDPANSYAATCLEEGVSAKKCKYCGDIKTSSIAKLTHNYVKDASGSVEATCNKEGKEIQKCTNCGDTKTTTIAKLTHNYVKDASGSVEATCNKEGKEIQKCTNCGDIKTTTIAKKDHNYKDDSSSSFEATCKKEGQKVKKCSICGDKKITTLAKTSHKYVEDSSNSSEATCAKEGKKAQKCSICGDVKTTTIAKLSHNYVADAENSRAATCDTEGVKAEKCSLCGISRTTTIAKTEHNYVADAESCVAANCTDPGRDVQKCSNCGDTKVTTIEALGHDLNDYYTFDSTNHYNSCSRCSYNVSEAHVNGGYKLVDGSNHYKKCSICGEGYDQDSCSLTGNWKFDDPKIDGHYKQCSVCGLKSSEPHYVSTWTQNQTSHSGNCGDCGAYISKSHNYENGYCTECRKEN